MKTRYEFLLQAALPIAHHAENIGNESLIFRRKVRYLGGWASVPIVTADTMRHGMREAAAYALLDAAGLLDAKLSEPALRLLFAGGMVTGRGDASVIKLDTYRRMCDLIPTMALFGGCAENRIIPGRLVVEDATLVCAETASCVPDWALEAVEKIDGVLDTHRAHVEDEQRVRMDPTLTPDKRLLLTPDAHEAVERRLLASEAAHSGDDAGGREASKSSMMPRRFERVAQGSYFAWATEGRVQSALELDTFHTAIGCFLADAWVGGKRGTGHGLLRPIQARQMRRGVAEPVRMEARGSERAIVDPANLARSGDLFRAHVQTKRDEIKEFLTAVNA